MKKILFLFAIGFCSKISAQNWSLTGNTGTSSSTNYIGTTDAQDLVFKVGNEKKMVLGTSGTLKIGTFVTPLNGINDFKLAVDGRSLFTGSINSDLIDVANTQQNIDTGYDLIYGNYKYYQPNDVGLFTFSAFANPTTWQIVFTARANGKVAMGTSNYNCASCAGYRLFVKDGIKTEKVKVEIASANGWADYVFEKDYKLMPLAELEKQIKEKGHLPNIPSASEVFENGINLGEMDAKLLAKIEELTLYTIDLNKNNDVLEEKTKNQEKLIQSLIKRIESLEKTN